MVAALGTGNVVAPSGNLYTQGQMPLVPTNAMVADPQEMGNIPIQPGKNVYIRDVATIQDTTDINYGCALVNGRRSIYIPVVKKDTASTLTVVQQIHDSMPLFQSVVPEDVTVRYEFDESPTVRAAIKSVATEGAIGALLTGLMILIFLRDVRTVIVVRGGHSAGADRRPGRPVAYGQHDQHHVAGRLGALDRHPRGHGDRHGGEHPRADAPHGVRGQGGAAERRGHGHVPVVGHALHPVGIHSDVSHAGAGPLAVHAADDRGGLCDDCRVPHVEQRRAGAVASGSSGTAPKSLPPRRASSSGFCPASRELCTRRYGCRWIVVPAYLAVCGLLLWLVGRQVGTELFPQVDSGQFVIRFRSPPGSEYELTRKCAIKVLEVIDEQTQGKVAISMGYVGLGATNTATNNILLFMRGTDDAQLRVRLQEGSGIRIQELRERLRKALPEQVVPWLKGVLEQEGCSPEEAEARAKKFSFGFEPGDIVSTVMSFGSPTPVEVVVAGPERDTVRAHALKVLEEMKKIPSLRDVQLYQQLDYPTVRVDIDREKAGLSGVTVKDVTDALLVGTSSSRYVAKNYWRDPKSGVDYQVQVQVPTQRMNRPQQVETLPLQRVNPDTNLMVRDVAKVQTGTAPGEIDRSAMQRYLSITANIEGDDLGRATGSHRRRPSPTPASRPAECASASAARLRR